MLKNALTLSFVHRIKRTFLPSHSIQAFLQVQKLRAGRENCGTSVNQLKNTRTVGTKRARGEGLVERERVTHTRGTRVRVPVVGATQPPKTQRKRGGVSRETRTQREGES